MVVRLDDDISAPASVAAVGAAVGHVFLPVEGNDSVSAVSGAYRDFCGIYKGCCHSGGLLT